MTRKTEKIKGMFVACLFFSQWQEKQKKLKACLLLVGMQKQDI